MSSNFPSPRYCVHVHFQDKVHTKDLSRFKAVLGTAKALNVPVAAK